MPLKLHWALANIPLVNLLTEILLADSAPYSDSAAHRAPRRPDRRDWAKEKPNPQATESIGG
jgi:hypothetical protein